MNTTTIAVTAAILSCLAATCMASPPATSTKVSERISPAQEKLEAFEAVQRLHASKTTPQFAEGLTNKSAAQYGFVEMTGMGVVASFQSLGDKPKDPKLDGDLTKYAESFGLTPKNVPSGSLNGLPAVLTKRGRQFLSSLVPFENRVQKVSNDTPILRPASSWPTTMSGYRILILKPDDVLVTILKPQKHAMLPKTFHVQPEDGKWRIDFGDLTYMTRVSS